MQDRKAVANVQVLLFLTSVVVGLNDLTASESSYFPRLNYPGLKLKIAIGLLTIVLLLALELFYLKGGKPKLSAVLTFIASIFYSLNPLFSTYLALWIRPLYRAWPKLRPYYLLLSLPLFLRGQYASALLVILALCIDQLILALAKYRSTYYSATDELNSRLRSMELESQAMKAASPEQERIIRKDEQLRISRALHDSIGHSLASALLQTEALKISYQGQVKSQQEVENSLSQPAAGLSKEASLGGQGAAESPASEVLLSQIDALLETLKTGLNDTRLTLHEMNQTAFDLADSIKDLDAQVPGRRIQFNLHFKADLPIQLRLDILNFCRIGIANYYRHSNGNHLTVTVIEQMQYIHLRLKDNGRLKRAWGSDEEQIIYLERSSLGLGLNNLEALAARYNSALKAGWKKDGFLLLANFQKPPQI
ncbi:MAG: histidine kinase [Eubacteriales bacterium]|nr:histidine kinase [Eubacteriales bacterium]